MEYFLSVKERAVESNMNKCAISLQRENGKVNRSHENGGVVSSLR